MERLYVGTAMNGRRGAVINAIGAIDMALHDLRGKALGKPCHELLGGARVDHITPYASLQPEVSGSTPTATRCAPGRCERASLASARSRPR